jgi:hypothetical protein
MGFSVSFIYLDRITNLQSLPMGRSSSGDLSPYQGVFFQRTNKTICQICKTTDLRSWTR